MKTKEILLITIATLLFSCTKPDPNIATITGKVTQPNGTYVEFESNDTTYASPLGEMGTFEITFPLDSAKYLRFKHGIEGTSMYVKPGDKIYLTIDPKQFDESIHYEGSETSSFLARVFLWREKTDFYGKEYFLGSPDEYQKKLEDLKAQLFSEFQTINDSTFIKVQKANVDRFLARYIRDQERFSKNELTVRMYYMKYAEIDKKYDFEAAWDSLDAENYWVMLNEYSDTINSLINTLTDKEMIKSLKKILESNINWNRQKKNSIDRVPKKGEPATDFVYADMDGIEYSLSSFKGRLIYVDVWASWCGPCIAEIPAMKKLLEEYRDKKITFLGISIDKDKDAWLKMLDEMELGGIQLWAGDLWGSDSISGITRDYAIFKIPRYMLISADGDIISTNAPRPSSTYEIRNLINSNL